MKIRFDTIEQKRKSFNKKNYVWKKTFLFTPAFVWFIKPENASYLRFEKNRSILWFCQMDKRTYIDSEFRKIIQYRECDDEHAETNGYYRNFEE